MTTDQRDVQDIVANAAQYHEKYYAVKNFGGPSLYFHLRALEMAGKDYDRCLEYIYAVLTSWGMHRMGSGGSKMQPFEIFQASMLRLREPIALAKLIRHEAVTEEDWAVLREIFAGIRVMASETRIVGNSKVMAHLLPNIVPPIDREYTLKFLKGNGMIRNGIDHEWPLMRRIIEGFFIPVARDKGFRNQAELWMADQDRYPWDTSLLKVVDNLVIGAMKARASGSESVRVIDGA
jgi:hypothetical protein